MSMELSFDPLSTVQQSSPADTTTVMTSAAPSGATACLITAETTAPRVTFDGTVPSATNGHLIQLAQNPLFVPCADRVRWVSSAVAVSTVTVTWLG